MNESVWIVYILQCSDGTLYCGITNNLKRRLINHNKGNGSKYTKARLPVSILKFFQVENKSVALKVELKIKKLSRKQKIDLHSIDHLIL